MTALEHVLLCSLGVALSALILAGMFELYRAWTSIEDEHEAYIRSPPRGAGDDELLAHARAIERLESKLFAARDAWARMQSFDLDDPANYNSTAPFMEAEGDLRRALLGPDDPEGRR